MENENFFEQLAGRFGQSAHVKNVFGEAIKAGEKTIIPVARVAFGFGGGYGQGLPKKAGMRHNETDASVSANEGKGAGGGGGMYARPKGVFVISNGDTKFVPVTEPKRLAVAMLAGFVLGSLWRRKRKSKRPQPSL